MGLWFHVEYLHGNHPQMVNTHLRYRLAMRQERKTLEATGGVMDPTTRHWDGLITTMRAKKTISVWCHMLPCGTFGVKNLCCQPFWSILYLYYIIYISSYIYRQPMRYIYIYKCCQHVGSTRLVVGHDTGWAEEKLLPRTPISRSPCGVLP